MEKAVASRCGAGLIGWLRFEKVAGVLGDWRHMVAFVVSENPDSRDLREYQSGREIIATPVSKDTYAENSGGLGVCRA